MIWLEVCVVLTVVSSPWAGAQEPVCDIPEGHTDGELVRTIGDPNGFESLLARCSKHTLIQKIIRRCESRYCCTSGCNCTDHDALHEQGSSCSDPTTVVALRCYVEDRVGPVFGDQLYCCLGYQFDDDRICVRTINCSNNNGGCDQSCVQEEKNGRCTCNDGYELHNKTKCKDMNECTLGTDECQEVCENTEGSYKCGCLTGFKLRSDGRTCQVDVNSNRGKPPTVVDPKKTNVGDPGSPQEKAEPTTTKGEDDFPWVYAVALPVAALVLVVILIFAICGLRSYKKKTKRLREERRTMGNQPTQPLQMSPIDLQLLQLPPLVNPQFFDPNMVQPGMASMNMENSYENLDMNRVDRRSEIKGKALPPLPARPVDVEGALDNPSYQDTQFDSSALSNQLNESMAAGQPPAYTTIDHLPVNRAHVT